MSFELPDLPYAYDALDANIDAQTMEIHHSKHHAGYTTKLNGALEGSDLAAKSIEEILAGAKDASAAIRNNGGGYYNHCLFWEVMSPSGGGQPSGELAKAIDDACGSFDGFKPVEFHFFTGLTNAVQKNTLHKYSRHSNT